MDRSTATTLARAMGASVRVSGRNFAAYQFPTEERAQEFRGKIPYASMLGGDRINNVQPLQVYFDEMQEF